MILLRDPGPVRRSVAERRPSSERHGENAGCHPGGRTCDNGIVQDRSHYPTRKLTLEEEGDQADLRRLTPEERVAMVWQLTEQAWTFKDGHWDEPRLRRDVVRTVRRGR